MNKTSLKIYVLLFYTFLIIVGSLGMPIGVSISTNWFLIKVHHIIGFGIYLLLVSVLLVEKLGINKAIIVSGTISFIFGLLLEVLQLFFPHRSGQLNDLISNLIGIVLFAILVKIYYSKCKSYK